jgi:hypothetical protein
MGALLYPKPSKYPGSWVQVLQPNGGQSVGQSTIPQVLVIVVIVVIEVKP